jgi:hypothetical protein
MIPSAVEACFPSLAALRRCSRFTARTPIALHNGLNGKASCVALERPYVSSIEFRPTLMGTARVFAHSTAAH